MSIFSSLNRQQKEAVGLLQIGTFLEYFDLMLYVHMAVLLNDLFFPKTDPHTASLLMAFAFCSTYVLRPFGAIIFGYIGDTIGRKTTVVITTMIMSISCMIMASLPTYAEIGVAAAWIVTICRMVQGISSMGEIVGCQIYITELIKPPTQYPAVSFINVASALGAVVALGIAVLVTSNGFNWRIAFWIGAGVAVIGSIARTRLREVPEFLDMQIELQKSDKVYKGGSVVNLKNPTIKQYIERCKTEKINRSTIAACFLIQCGWPITFYLAFMCFNPILKEQYFYTPEDIIFHNFFLSIVMLFAFITWAKLSYRVHPLKILKEKAKIFGVLILFLPFLLSQVSSLYQIFSLQSFILIVSLCANPADSILIKSIPIFKRFTATSFIYALSRAFVYIFTSFGLVYLTEMIGYYGVWVIALPLCIGFLWSVEHFKKLEKKGLPVKNTPHLRVAS